MGIVRTPARIDNINATLAAVAALPQCDPFIRSVLRTHLAGKLERDHMLENVLFLRAMTSSRSEHHDAITRWTSHAEAAAVQAVCDLLGGRKPKATITRANEYLGKIERAERREADKAQEST